MDRRRQTPEAQASSCNLDECMNQRFSRCVFWLTIGVAVNTVSIRSLSAQDNSCAHEGVGRQIASDYEVGPDLLCDGGVVNLTPPLSIPGRQSLSKCPAFVNFEPAYVAKRTKPGFRVTATRPLTGYLVLYNCETSYFLFMFPWDKKCNVASQTPFGSFLSHTGEGLCQGSISKH